MREPLDLDDADLEHVAAGKSPHDAPGWLYLLGLLGMTPKG